jgi:hypothetical protein
MTEKKSILEREAEEGDPRARIFFGSATMTRLAMKHS